MKTKRIVFALVVAAMTAGSGTYDLQAQAPPAPGYQDQKDWEAPPKELREVGQSGFHDGIVGARKDFENHRRPNVNNREEYRHPKTFGRDLKAYRQGFRRGYEVGVDHLMHSGRPR